MLDDTASGKLCLQAILVHIRPTVHCSNHHLIMDVFLCLFLLAGCNTGLLLGTGLEKDTLWKSSIRVVEVLWVLVGKEIPILNDACL
jgi:hypothetical protein